MSRERWEEAYRGYQASGLSQKEYCRQNEISFGHFKAGIKKAQLAGMIKLSGRSRGNCGRKKTLGFMSVEVTGESAPCGGLEAPYCEIRLRGRSGIRIETEAAMVFWIETMRGLSR